MDRRIRAIGMTAKLVCLLLVMMTTTMPQGKAPDWNDRTYDVVWDGNTIYPDDDDPAWTRTTTGTVSRAFQYHNQIMNISLTGASADKEKYSISFSSTYYAYAEARLNMPISGSAVILRFDESNGDLSVQMTIGSNNMEMNYYDLQNENAESITHYEEDIVGNNHTYAIMYHTDQVESFFAMYYDHNLVGWDTSKHKMKIDEFYFSCQDSPPSVLGRYVEWSYVALDLSGAQTKIDGLQDEIDLLKKELAALKKEVDDDRPTFINQTSLPTIPHTTRGDIDDNVAFLDPYRTTVYSVNAEGSGTSVAMYLPYPTTADEITCIRDDLWIGGSYTRIWVNDTVGATELLNSTSTYTYFNVQYCYNITVESTGGDIIANRIVDVRLIDSFQWGENLDTGLFAHRSSVENTIAYDMENVRIYWAFPEEDSKNRAVFIDMQSVEVKDMDNNVVLDKGRHYEVTEAGVSLEIRWLNTSQDRDFKITFTRESFVEREEYYTIYDSDVKIDHDYPDTDYYIVVNHVQQGSANFEGKIIIKFVMTGKFMGEKLNVATIMIQRSDQSGFLDFSYDSVSGELRIPDQTVAAGDSVGYTVHFSWLDEPGIIIGTLTQYPLIIGALMLGLGVMSVMWLAQVEGKKRHLGWIGIGIDVVALIVVIALV